MSTSAAPLLAIDGGTPARERMEPYMAAGGQALEEAEEQASSNEHGEEEDDVATGTDEPEPAQSPEKD